MKKLALALLVAAPMTAFGQSTTPTGTTGDVTFNGSQDNITSMSFTAGSGSFSALDSEAATNARLEVANGTTFNNVQAGYTLTFESDNNFTMVNAASNGESFVPYDVVYTDQAAQTVMGNGGATAEDCSTIPAAKGETVLDHDENASSQNGTPQGVAASTSVSYGFQNCGYQRDFTVQAQLTNQNKDFELLSGSYEDTITVTVSANEVVERVTIGNLTQDDF